MVSRSNIPKPRLDISWKYYSHQFTNVHRNRNDILILHEYHLIIPKGIINNNIFMAPIMLFKPRYNAASDKYHDRQPALRSD